MSAASRAGSTTPPSRSPPTSTSQLDREIEVGAGDRELVAGQLETQARQHGQRAGAAGGGTAGSGQRFGQDFTFATELHRVAFLDMR